MPLSLLLALSLRLAAQERQESLGLHLGAGGHWFGLVHYLTPYDYELVLFDLSYTLQVWNRKAKTIDFVARLNAAGARFAEPSGPPWKNSGEFGAAFGLRYCMPIAGSDHSAYLMVLFGPHHITDAPQRQVPGFVVNNSGSGGVLIKVADKISLDLCAGWRHLSNAGLKEPNGGINTVLAQVGLVIWR